MKTDHASPTVPPPKPGVLRVELFAGMAAAAGRRSVELPWQGGTVADLRRALSGGLPPVADLLARSAIAIDDRYAVDDAEVPVTAAVSVIPPVSGG